MSRGPCLKSGVFHLGFSSGVVKSEEGEGVKFWGFGKTVYQELLSIIADPDYGDISDPVNGRDVVVGFKTAEEVGSSFPKTNIRVKPNQTPVTENKAVFESILENQKNITEIYQEQSYDELAEVLQNWLSPSDDETTTKESDSATEATLEQTTTVTNASEAFDELFNK